MGYNKAEIEQGEQMPTPLELNLFCPKEDPEKSVEASVDNLADSTDSIESPNEGAENSEKSLLHIDTHVLRCICAYISCIYMHSGS